TTCPTESKQSVSSAVMSHGWSAVSSVHEDASMQSMTRLAAAVQTSLLPTYVSVKYSKQDSGHESSSLNPHSSSRTQVSWHHAERFAPSRSAESSAADVSMQAGKSSGTRQ